MIIYINRTKSKKNIVWLGICSASCFFVQGKPLTLLVIKSRQIVIIVLIISLLSYVFIFIDISVIYKLIQ